MGSLSPAARVLLDSGTIDDLLRVHGRPAVDQDAVSLLDGRNLNLRAPLADGSAVFVKHFLWPNDGDDSHVAANLARALRFEDFRRESGGLRALGAPGLVGADEAHRLMVFESLDGARTLAELADDDELTAALLRDTGRALGTLHAAPAEDVSAEPHRFPPMRALQAIPLGSWLVASAAELQAWRLMQQDAELAAALARLRAREETAATSAVHGDLRLDQVLVTSQAVHLTDFEDFRRGDAGRDVGALLGELVYRAVLSIVKDWSGSFSMDVSFTHEEIVQRGSEELDARLPFIEAFWEGYRTAAPTSDDLLERSAAWLGWHMFDRLLASSADRNKLLSVHRAAAGIGRAILLAPQKYVDTLGMR